jgi:ankyrin repeat protein
MKKFFVTVILIAMLGAGSYYAYEYYDTPQGSIFDVVKDGTPNQIVKMVERGEDINAIDENDTSVLMHAISKHDNADNVVTLLELGVDMAWKGQISPLMLACISQKDIRVFEAFEKRNADFNEKGYDNVTPLMLASGSQYDTDIIKMFIKKGADINAETNIGQTPLMFAAEMNQNPEIAKVLIAEGAEVNHTNKEGRSMVISAGMFDNVVILEELLKAGAKIRELDLMMGIYNNFSPEVIGVYAREVGNLNFIDEAGNTPLTLAMSIEEPNIKVIETLIENGADVNFADGSGQTALMKALYRSNEPFALRILEDTWTYFDMENTPEEMRKEITSMREHRRSVNLELTKLLIKTGADVNMQDDDGMSPLMIAAVKGKDTEFLDLLKGAGLDINLVNNYGKNAYDLHKEWMQNRDMMMQRFEESKNVKVEIIEE